MRIEILDPAKDGLIECYIFYESLEAGVGDYFLESIYGDIDKLSFTAASHPIYDPPYYQMLANKFPFTIYYRVEDEVAYVDAIIDQRRDPEWISERLN